MLSVIAGNSGDTTVLRCFGRLVAGEEGWSLYNHVISLPTQRALVLDLTGVERVDARGIGVLLFVKQWASGNGMELEVIASKPVQDMLELTGLDSHFDVQQSDEGDARKGRGRPAASSKGLSNLQGRSIGSDLATQR